MVSAVGNDDTPAAPAATPPAPREKPLLRLVKAIASAVSKRMLSLCWIPYALSVVWVLLHPAVTVTTGELKPRGTYMSENALLVDSMDAQASYREELRVKAYHQALLSIDGLQPTGCHDDCSRVTDWLLEQLHSIDRVEAYSQRFSKNRSNVYGILRASPLADHKESIVLTAHYRNIGATSTNAPFSGVALGLALLEFLAQAKWLAKDVILVFPDDGPNDGVDGFAPGSEAWLRAYHSDPLHLDATEDSLPMRAGLIRAAINLETIGDISSVDVVGVFTAGMNGQLPNLDLVNTAVRHAMRHSVPVVLDRCLTVQQQWTIDGHYEASTCQGLLDRSKTALLDAVASHVPLEHRTRARDYVSNLFGMLRFMRSLATGPSGVHGHFIRYNIDAVTFAMARSVDAQHWQGGRSIQSVLRSLELLVRSMSSLEEKLHQSFFLYVLPNNRDFVSIGEYYYTVPLAISPAFAHLATTLAGTAGMRMALALAVVLVVEVVGVLALVAMTTLPFYQVPWLFAVALAQAVVVLLLVPWLRGVAVLSGNTHAREWRARTLQFDASKGGSATPSPPVLYNDDAHGWRAIKSAMLTLIVFAHCVLGILNYPLALFCALPMAFFALVEPHAALASRPLKRVLVPVLLLLSSPLALLSLPGLGDTLLFLTASFVGGVNLIALPYLCCLYVPVHTLALAVWFSPVATPSKAHIE